MTLTETLDLHEQLSGGVLRFSHLAFDPLVRWTKNFQFEPRLATEWEQVDDTTMRMTLREGVTFHSGNPRTTAPFLTRLPVQKPLTTTPSKSPRLSPTRCC